MARLPCVRLPSCASPSGDTPPSVEGGARPRRPDDSSRPPGGLRFTEGDSRRGPGLDGLGVGRPALGDRRDGLASDVDLGRPRDLYCVGTFPAGEGKTWRAASILYRKNNEIAASVKPWRFSRRHGRKRYWLTFPANLHITYIMVDYADVVDVFPGEKGPGFLAQAALCQEAGPPERSGRVAASSVNNEWVARRCGFPWRCRGV